MVLRNEGKRASKVIADLHGREGEFKLLILDIETFPNVGTFWALWDQNIGINQVQEWSSVACFAAKWYGQKKIHFHSNFHDGHDEMVLAAHRLLDEADAVIHYNGKAFDVKHLNREFLLAELPPPKPHKDIDLLTIIRSTFKFPSNKLDAISQALKVGSKVKHEGMELWLACRRDDPKAWARMKKYNIGDITITEAVYERVRGWIRTHPHVGLYTGDLSACPKCGSNELIRRGFAYTPTQVCQQRQCKK